MSDQHIRILIAQARHGQSRLDAYDAAGDTEIPSSSAAGESSRNVPAEREQASRLLAHDGAQ